VQHESHKSLSVVLDEKSELKSVLETEVLEKVMETYQRVQKVWGETWFDMYVHLKKGY